MEEVFSQIDKVIIDDSAQGDDGVLTYLPLPEIRKRSAETTEQEQ